MNCRICCQALFLPKQRWHAPVNDGSQSKTMPSKVPGFGMRTGLVAGMEGMVPGDRREVAVTFPDNWEPESLAGLAAKCDVVVKELFCYDLIEVCEHATVDFRQLLCLSPPTAPPGHCGCRLRNCMFLRPSSLIGASSGLVGMVHLVILGNEMAAIISSALV